MPATWDEIRTFGLSPPRYDQDTVLLRLGHAELDNEVEEIITEAWRIAENQAKQARAL